MRVMPSHSKNNPFKEFGLLADNMRRQRLVSNAQEILVRENEEYQGKMGWKDPLPAQF
jgi:hypothetical protein